ncbi:hypothetical protein L6R46_23790 [Myxococcota bacterium]|jgi:hypothetical protein|nr:hypothetical protein [Myxococcota bacterium]
MPFSLTADERQTLHNMPEGDLADLAMEVAVVLDEVINRESLLLQILPRLVDLGRKERGLPLSDYDLEDLVELPPPHRAALARALGWPEDPAGMVKQGKKVFKTFERTYPKSAVTLLVPTLLRPLARFAAEGP